MPAAIPVNLSTLAAANVPAPAGKLACTIELVDLTAAPGATPCTTGTLAVPVAGAHQVSVTLISAVALNTIQINGVTPGGWSNVGSGFNAIVIPDQVGFWTFICTSAGVLANSVTIQAY